MSALPLIITAFVGGLVGWLLRAAWPGSPSPDCARLRAAIAGLQAAIAESCGQVRDDNEDGRP